MKSEVQTISEKARISPDGRFDSTVYQTFKQCYEALLKVPEVKELEIDMSAVEYIDSSALGMLLMLKEKASAVDKTIVLTNCRNTVGLVLDIANFGKLFSIRYA